MSRHKIHAAHPEYKRTLCFLSTSETGEWPKGGATVGLYESDVTCKQCLRELWVQNAPKRFEALPEIEDPKKVSIGSKVLVRSEARVSRTQGYAQLEADRIDWREAIVVGWAARWTSWSISGHHSYDGDAPIAQPKSTGVLLRVRYTPNGAEKLVFPQDARLLGVEGADG